jgi:hypothetical protein
MFRGATPPGSCRGRYDTDRQPGAALQWRPVGSLVNQSGMFTSSPGLRAPPPLARQIIQLSAPVWRRDAGHVEFR